MNASNRKTHAGLSVRSASVRRIQACDAGKRLLRWRHFSAVRMDVVLFSSFPQFVCRFSATGTEKQDSLSGKAKSRFLVFFVQRRLKLCLRATVEAVCRGRAHVLSELLPAGTRKHYLVISACWHRQLILVWIMLRLALSPSFLFSEKKWEWPGRVVALCMAVIKQIWGLRAQSHKCACISAFLILKNVCTL